MIRTLTRGFRFALLLGVFLISFFQIPSLSAAGCIQYQSQVNSAMARQDVPAHHIKFQWKAYTDGCVSEHETKVDSEWRFNIYRMNGATPSLEASYDGSTWSGAEKITKIDFVRNSTNGTFDLTIKAMNSAVKDNDYYIEVQRVTGDANETIAVSSKASTTADASGNKGLGGGGGTGEFAINYANLIVLFATGDTRTNSRSSVPFSAGADGVMDGQTGESFKQGDASNNSIVFAYTIKYPDGTDWVKDSADLNLKVYSSSNADRTAQYTVFDAGYVSPYYYTRIVPTSSAVTGTDFYFAVGTDATSTATGDYLPEFSSKAGTSGGNTGLNGHSPDGTFDTTAGDLSITYLSRSVATIDQGAASGVTYSFRTFFPNGTDQETASAGDYTVRVYNAGGVDKSADFNIGALAYNAGTTRWEVTVSAKTSSTVATGYHISVQKSSGASPSTLAEYKSNQGTTGANVGLSSPGGEFEVQQGSLHIVYQTPAVARTIYKADDAQTIDFSYNVYYADGSTEETSDYGYIVKVYRSDNPGVALSTFSIAAPGTQFGVLNTGSHITDGNFTLRRWEYTGGKWNINLKARADAMDTVGGANDGLHYSITIEKDAGGGGETFTAYSSDASTTPDGNGNAGLGTTNGRFEVESSALTIKFTSRDNAAMQRLDLDANLVTYHFTAHYPDGSGETNDTGYAVELFDSSNASLASWSNLAFNTGTVNQTSGEWTLVSFDYSGGTYNAKFRALGDVNAASGYYVTVTKAAGNEGDATAAAKSSKDATGTAYDGGLGATDGVFQVNVANLAAVFANPGSHQSIEVADDGTITFMVTVTYPNGTAAQAGDGNYTLTVYNAAGTAVETFANLTSGNTPTGTKFDLTQFTNVAGTYTVTLQSHDKTTDVGNDYYISIQKASGGADAEDLLAERDSKADPGAVNGSFNVTSATLAVSVGSISVNSINKGDTTGLYLYYNVYFDRGAVGSNNAAYQETDDAGNYGITIRDSGNNDDSGDYTITGPSYGAYGASCGGAVTSCYRVQVAAKFSASVASGYSVEIAKSAGTHTIASAVDSSAANDNNLSDGIDGLGAPGGEFSVDGAILSIKYRARRIVSEAVGVTGTDYMTRADGATNQIVYDFSAHYPDTSEKNNGDGWQIQVLDSADSVVATFSGLSAGSANVTSGNWTLVSFSNASNRWSAQIKASDAVTVTALLDNGYYINVSKAVATDKDFTPAAKTSTSATGTATDGGLENPTGRFRVMNATELSTPPNRPLVMQFQDPGSVQSVRRGNQTAGASFSFRTLYPDGTTYENNDLSSYTILVKDSTNATVDSFPATGAAQNGTNFRLSAVTNAADVWSFTLYALSSASIANGYYVSIVKNNTGEGDSFAEEASTVDQPANGKFNVTGGRLHAVYAARNNAIINQWDGSPTSDVTYTFDVLYEDNAELTAGLNAAHIKVFDSTNADVTADFDVTAGPTYAAGQWSVTVNPKISSSAGTGFYIQLSYVDGAAGNDNIYTQAGPGNYYFNSNFTGTDTQGNAGLGTTNGVFEIRNATMEFVDIVDNDGTDDGITERSPQGSGITFRYRLYQGTSATEITNEGANQVIRVLRDAGALVAAGLYTAAGPTYNAGAWEYTIYPHKNFTIDNDLYIGVAKPTGTDRMQEFFSSAGNDNDRTDGVDGLGTGVNNGQFQVTYATLAIQMDAANGWMSGTGAEANEINRQDANPVTMDFTVRYDANGSSPAPFNDGSYLTSAEAAGGTQTGTGSATAVGAFLVTVRDAANADVTTSFQRTIAYQGSNTWRLTLNALGGAPSGAGFYAEIRKNTGDSFIGTAGATTVLSTKAGTDAQSPYANNGASAAGDAGVFSINNGNVTLAFQGITVPVTSPVRRMRQGSSLANGAAVTFRMYYENGTQKDDTPAAETDEASFVVKIYDSSNALIDTITGLNNATNTGANSLFEAGTVTYTGGNWQFSLRAIGNNINYYDNYYISIQKNAGTDGDDTSEIKSNSAVAAAPADSGLGATNGALDVSDLNINYTSRSVASIKQADAVGVTYQFNIKEADNSNKAGLTPGNFSARVYHTGVDVTAAQNFTVGTVTDLGSGNYSVNIRAAATTAVQSGYYVRVSYQTAATGDVLDPFDSTAASDGGTPANAGLAAGDFAVAQQDALQVHFDAIAHQTMSRSDASGNVTNYTFTIYYPDGTNEGSQSGYQIRVYNEANTLVDTFSALADGGSDSTGNTSFDLVSFIRSGNAWVATLKALKDAPLDTVAAGSGYYIAVSKPTGGGNGDTLPVANEIKSMQAVVAAPASAGLGDAAGEGRLGVSAASLAVDYTGKTYTTGASVEKADNDTVSFTFRVVYPDGTTLETGDSSYTVTVTDGTHTDTFSALASGGNDLTGNTYFDLMAFNNVAGVFTASLRPKKEHSHLVSNNWYITLQKSDGGAGAEDTTPGAVASTLADDANLTTDGGDGLGTGTAANQGNISVVNASLAATFQAVSGSPQNRGMALPATPDGNNAIRYQMELFYDNTSDEINNADADISSVTVTIRDVATSSYRNAQFLYWDGSSWKNADNAGTSAIVPNWDGGSGRWVVDIVPKETAAAESYRLDIAKAAGVTGDTLATVNSTTNFTVNYGVLNLAWDNPSGVKLERANGQGYVFSYTLSYPNGVVVDNTNFASTGLGSPSFTVHSTANGDQTANFYATGTFAATPDSTPNPTVFTLTGAGYDAGKWKLRVIPEPGATLASDFYIRAVKAAGDTIVSTDSGNFEVTQGTLNVVWGQRNATNGVVNSFDRQDGVGTHYYFRLLYDDPAYEFTTDAASLGVSVLKKSDDTAGVGLTAGAATYGAHGEALCSDAGAGHTSCFRVNITADATTPAGDYYPLLSKAAGVTGDTLDKKRANFGYTAFGTYGEPDNTSAADDNDNKDPGGFSNTVTNSYAVDDEDKSDSYTSDPASYGHFSVNYEQTLSVKWLAKTVGKFWRGNTKGTFYAFRLFYEDHTTQYTNTQHTDQSNTFTIKLINSAGTTIDEFTGLGSSASGVNGTNAKFQIENFSYDSGADARWELKLLALSTADINDGYYVEVTSQNGGMGDFIPATSTYRASNSATTVLAYEGGLGAGTAANQGQFALSNVCVKWIDRQNASMEQNDNTADLVKFRFELYRDEGGTTCGTSGTEITAADWAAGDWGIIIRDSANANVNANFTTGAPVNTNGVPNFNAGTGYWEYTVKANAQLTVVATDYSLDVEINDFDGASAAMMHSSDNDINWDGGTPSDYTIPPGMGTTNGRFAVTNASLNTEFLARDTSSFEKVDGAGTNFTFKIFYDDGSYVTDTDVNSLSGAASYVYKIYNSDNVHQDGGRFTAAAPTFNGVDTWSLNVQANISSVSAAGYSLAILKDGTDATGDTLAATNSFPTVAVNHEASSKTTNDGDFTDGVDGLGTTDGVFEVKNATLGITFLARSIDKFPKGDGVGVTFSAKTFYGDGTTQDENNAGSYVITVYDSANAAVSANFNKNVTWDAANSKYDINIQATVNATVATGYYIKVTGGPSGAQVLDTGGRTPFSNAAVGGDGFRNYGLGVPGGNFEVQGAPLAIRFSNVTTNVGGDRIHQRLSSPADGSGDFMQLQFKAYYPNGTDEESKDYGYKIKIYDKNNVDRTNQFLFWKWANNTAGDATGAWDSTPAAGGAVDTAADNYVKYEVVSGQIYWYLRLSPKENAGATASYNNYYVTVTKEAGGRGDIISSELSSKAADDNSFAVDYVDGLGATAGTWAVNPADMTVKYLADNNAGENKIFRADKESDPTKIISADFDLYYPDQSTKNADANGGFTVTVYTDAGHVSQETFTGVVPDPDLDATGAGDFTPVTGTNSRFKLVNFGWDPSDSRWRLVVKPLQEAILDMDYHIGISKNAGVGDGFENVISTAQYSNAATGTVYSGGLGTGTGVGTTGEWEIRKTPLTLAYTGESKSATANQIQKADGTGITFYYKAYFPDQSTTYTKETADAEYTIKVYKNGIGEVDSFASVSPNPAGDTYIGVTGTNSLYKLVDFNYDSVNSRWNVKITAFADAVADLTNYYYISIEKSDTGTATVDENSIALKNSNDPVSGIAYDTGLGTGIGGAGTNTGEFELQKAELVVLYTALDDTSVQRYDPTGFEYQWKVFYPDEATEETNDNIAYKIVVKNSSGVNVTDKFDVWNYTNSYWKTDFAPATGITGADYIRYNAGSWALKLRPKKDTLQAGGYFIALTKDGSLGEGDTLTAERKSNEADSGDVVDDGTPNNSDGIDALGVAGEVTVTGADLKIKYVTDNSPAAGNAIKRQGTGSMVYDFELYYPDTTGNCDNAGAGSCAAEFSGTTQTGGYEIKLYADTDGNNTPDAVVETFPGVQYGTDWATPIPEIYGINNRFALKNFGWDAGSGHFKMEIRALNDTRDVVHTLSLAKVAVSAPDDNISTERKSNSASVDAYAGGLGTGTGAGDTGEWMVNPGVLTMKYLGTLTKNADNRTAPHDGTGISYYFNLFYENGTEHRNGVEYWDGSAWQTDSDAGIDKDSAGKFTLTVYDSASAVVESFANVDPSGGFAPVTGTNEKILLKNFRYDAANDRWEVNIVPMQKVTRASDYYVSLSKVDNSGTQDGDEETLAEKISKDATGTAYNGGLGTGTGDDQGEFVIIPASLIIKYADLFKTDAPATTPVSMNRGAAEGSGVTLYYNVYFEDGDTEEKVDTGYIVKVFNGATEVESFDTTQNKPIAGSKFTLQNFSHNGSRYALELLAQNDADKLIGYHFTVEKSAGTYPDTLVAYSSNASTTPDPSGNKGLNAGADEGLFNVAGEILHIIYASLSKTSLTREDATGTQYSWNVRYADTSEETDDITGYSVVVRRSDASAADTFTYNADGTPVTGTGSYFTSGNLAYNAGAWKVTVTPRKTAYAENGYYIGVSKVIANEPDSFPEYSSNASTTPDPSGNKGLNAGANEGAFDVAYANMTLSYLSRSAAVIEHGNPSSYTRYTLRILYPNGTVFTSDDAGVGDVSGATNTLNVKIYKGAADRTADFTVTGSPSYDAASGNWLYEIRAPYTTAVESDFFLKAEVTATGADDLAASLDSNDAGALAAGGVFAVGNVRLLSQWQSVSPLTIKPGETTTATLLLTFPDGSPFDNGTALTSSNFDVKRLESGASDLLGFSVAAPVYLTNGRWRVDLTAQSESVSKVGDYLTLSGTTSTSDFIRESSSNADDQLKDKGVFVVMKDVFLHQNFPNPFNPNEGKTTIRIDIPESDRGKAIEMKLFTVTGQLVRSFETSELVNFQKLIWDGKNQSGMTVASGIYYFVLVVGDEKQYIKIAVVK